MCCNIHAVLVLLACQVSALECIPLLLDVLAMGGAGPGAVRPGPLQMQSQGEKARIQSKPQAPSLASALLCSASCK